LTSISLHTSEYFDLITNSYLDLILDSHTDCGLVKPTDATHRQCSIWQSCLFELVQDSVTWHAPTIQGAVNGTKVWVWSYTHSNVTRDHGI
jgi:hypothetical protein